MSSSYLALVADQPCFARALEAHLHKSLGQPALVCSFESIREHLGPDTPGVLVLGAASTAGAEQIVRLVQEIHLQKWPLTIFALLGKAAALSKDLACLQGYIAQELHWPADALLLSGLVGECLGRDPILLGSEPKTLETIISRRLLCWTPSLLPLVDRIVLAGRHDVPVLLTGETGTGKTYLARLIHQASERKHHRMLVVPCGALVANLIESELFGHTEGAFTGADRPRVGKFAAAGEGTLLLDEIEALGLENQVKLTRVLETGEYEPVGSNETQRCSARIIIASNWNLEEAVEQGKFRRDLYYRLNVLPFHLPPLRERVQDIELLVRGLAARFSEKFHKGLFDIRQEAMAALEVFPWPGNLRQLEHAVQQAVLVSSGPLLLLEHLPPLIQEYAQLTNRHHVLPGEPIVHDREMAERTSIQRALAKCGYKRARAASLLGISRTTFYRKLKKYGFMEVRREQVPAG